MMRKMTRPTRFFSLLLILSLALSLLAGCGTKQKETQQGNQESQTNGSDAEKDKPDTGEPSGTEDGKTESNTSNKINPI